MARVPNERDGLAKEFLYLERKMTAAICNPKDSRWKLQRTNLKETGHSLVSLFPACETTKGGIKTLFQMGCFEPKLKCIVSKLQTHSFISSVILSLFRHIC